MRWLIGLLLLVNLGCASTTHAPLTASADELYLQYDGGFEVWSNGSLIATGPGWAGLQDHVGCSPAARKHAEAAESEGGFSMAYRILGGGLALGGVGAFVGGVANFDDKDGRWVWVGAGLSSVALATVFAVLGRHKQVQANGNAVDALNYFNDAVYADAGQCR